MIGEELWCCHDGGVNVYDCHWKKLREIRIGSRTTSLAALDTATVVIATYTGLQISSTSGLSISISYDYIDKLIRTCVGLGNFEDANATSESFLFQES